MTNVCATCVYHDYFFQPKKLLIAAGFNKNSPRFNKIYHMNLVILTCLTFLVASACLVSRTKYYYPGVRYRDMVSERQLPNLE